MTSQTGPSDALRPIRPAGVSQWARRGRGFTLIELILVMLIVCLGAALAAPALGRFAYGRQDVDAAAHMLAVMQYAQDRAIATGMPSRLQLDTAKGVYWLTARHDGVYSASNDEFGRKFTLPDSLTLSLNAQPDVVSRGYIEFDPDGGHDVAVIHLTSRDRGVTLLGCTTTSEPYRIYDSAQAREVQ